jgi:hypothetical protein
MLSLGAPDATSIASLVLAPWSGVLKLIRSAGEEICASERAARFFSSSAIRKARVSATESLDPLTPSQSPLTFVGRQATYTPGGSRAVDGRVPFLIAARILAWSASPHALVGTYWQNDHKFDCLCKDNGRSLRRGQLSKGLRLARGRHRPTRLP